MDVAANDEGNAREEEGRLGDDDATAFECASRIILQSLTDAVVEKILSFTEWKELLAGAAVSHQWSRIAKKDSLWKPHYRSRKFSKVSHPYTPPIIRRRDLTSSLSL
eukprot:jgi/Bigna1/144001/aug1.83_g18709